MYFDMFAPFYASLLLVFNLLLYYYSTFQRPLLVDRAICQYSE